MITQYWSSNHVFSFSPVFFASLTRSLALGFCWYQRPLFSEFSHGHKEKKSHQKSPARQKNTVIVLVNTSRSFEENLPAAGLSPNPPPLRSFEKVKCIPLASRGLCGIFFPNTDAKTSRWSPEPTPPHTLSTKLLVVDRGFSLINPFFWRSSRLPPPCNLSIEFESAFF